VIKIEVGTKDQFLDQTFVGPKNVQKKMAPLGKKIARNFNIEIDQQKQTKKNFMSLFYII